MLPEAQNKTVCFTCPSSCCINFRVPITGSDLYRLVTSHALNPADVGIFAPFTNEDKEPDILYFEPGGHAYQLSLQKKGLPEKSQTHLPCAFLLEFDDQTKRCGVYDTRPMSCRQFPTKLSERGVILYGHELCPPNAWSLERVDLSVMRLLTQIVVMEGAIYKAFIRRWNRFAELVPEGRRLTETNFFRWIMGFNGKVDSQLGVCYDDQDHLARLAGRWIESIEYTGCDPVDIADSEVRTTAHEIFAEDAQILIAIQSALDDLDHLVEIGQMEWSGERPSNPPGENGDGDAATGETPHGDG